MIRKFDVLLNFYHIKFSYYIKNKKFNNQLNTIKKDTSYSTLFIESYLVERFVTQNLQIL